MDVETRRFLTSFGLRRHVILLLELNGVRKLRDLLLLDDVLIHEIQNRVRNGNISIYASHMERAAMRIKYLGFNYRDIRDFEFLPVDMYKLRRLKPAVQMELRRQAELIRQLQRQNRS